MNGIGLLIIGLLFAAAVYYSDINYEEIPVIWTGKQIDEDREIDLEV